MAKGNIFKDIRENEGISKAELSRRTGVAEKIIRKIENNDLSGARKTTKARLVNGINAITGKSYKYKEIFSND